MCSSLSFHCAVCFSIFFTSILRARVCVSVVKLVCRWWWLWLLLLFISLLLENNQIESAIEGREWVKINNTVYKTCSRKLEKNLLQKNRIVYARMNMHVCDGGMLTLAFDEFDELDGWFDDDRWDRQRHYIKKVTCKSKFDDGELLPLNTFKWCVCVCERERELKNKFAPIQCHRNFVLWRENRTSSMFQPNSKFHIPSSIIQSIKWFLSAR